MDSAMRTAESPQPYRWSTEAYYRLGELGVFAGSHVQLIEGEIVEMPPIGPEHSIGSTLVLRALRLAFDDRYLERVQQPLDLGPASQPEPDVAFVFGSTAEFTARHPATAALVAEIANTSLQYDRREKASLYAKAGILDDWIINLVDRCLEVHRDPGVDSSQPSGWTFSTVFVVPPSETIAPLANPDVTIRVANLLA
ncbi:MAG: Uma2 family endonuclease [Chloroflexi bacterium]|nr:Uma2 family endonuclease [Chloroflexota bacterium]